MICPSPGMVQGFTNKSSEFRSDGPFFTAFSPRSPIARLSGMDQITVLGDTNFRNHGGVSESGGCWQFVPVWLSIPHSQSRGAGASIPSGLRRQRESSRLRFRPASSIARPVSSHLSSPRLLMGVRSGIQLAHIPSQDLLTGPYSQKEVELTWNTRFAGPVHNIAEFCTRIVLLCRGYYFLGRAIPIQHIPYNQRCQLRPYF